MSKTPIGNVVAIAVRTTTDGPMRQVAEAEASLGGGLMDDLPVDPDRGITFLAADQWDEVTKELQRDLPWHTRRANVLVDCATLVRLLGKSIRVGTVTVEIQGVTEPCGLMDRICPGLMNALTPDSRGGVHGKVVQSGTIKVGDTVMVQEEDV